MKPAQTLTVIILFAGMMLTIVAQWRTSSRLRHENQELRSAGEQAERTRTELEQAAQTAARRESELQPSADEVLTLRSELETVRQELEQAKNTRPLPEDARQRCRATLHRIDGAKAQWALENRKTQDEIPTGADLFGPGRYMPEKPKCPSGGSYTLGTGFENPRCSISGHTY